MCVHNHGYHRTQYMCYCNDSVSTEDEKLTGPIPTELGQLDSLTAFSIGKYISQTSYWL